ncbi:MULTISPECIES: hypothetical protein [Aerococcus]|uniref:EbhA n=1 Tax=Aerococcus mictus TaxID=2976810 RepID=A0A1E9PKQ2_9LACT|nr:MULTISPECIES: hypothetical protein [Aerococcus]AEA00692.1 hypothetical protein HMPREF9243_0199 [Aerococcus sp. Group 1]KAA9290381.1 hypothetical protein F6I06_08840 [Aerococcus mictus]MBU5610875.1 hypothetical protein [Aerococcus urinae]MCY3031639.1 hypothetical protein [Aerococcus sp. Group 1]MCY3039753.1 hypothetical protein [Aerococcus sp. Group 2]
MSRNWKSFIAVVLVFVALLSGCTSKEERAAIDSFKEVSGKVEKMNTDLDKQIADAEDLVKKNEKALDEQAIGKLETAVSQAKSAKVEVPEQPKKLEELKSETEKLNKADYTSVTQEIADTKKAYEDSVKQLKQVTAPEEKFVIERIQSVEGVTGISAVTEDNDPNKQLGKQGGYTAQVYFSYNLVNQEEVFGNSLIDKGTEAGGSIEVYQTAEDAEKRNTYLGAFDGSPISPGSHRVVGTVIVRVSNQLTASQQKELEEKLIASLTEIK